MVYKQTFKTLWSSFDANKHMRHTAYNDYAAESRVRFFNSSGFDIERWESEHFGPILFSEETKFLREIKLGDDITVETYLEGMSENAERFKFFHRLLRKDGVLAAEIRVYGAWLDTQNRKLTAPPEALTAIFKHLERTDDFQEIPIKSTK